MIFFQGQWRNDMYNGEGSMIHCSGFIYEGIWLNGKPCKMATKLVITGEPVLELTQGQTFTIEVECQGEDDEKLEGKFCLKYFKGIINFLSDRDYVSTSGLSR
jgi:hypothetical protein